MKRLSVVELKRSLGAVLDRAEAKGRRVVIQRRGKDVAALVPIEDLKLLERLIEEEEDRIDLAAAEAALAKGGEGVPYDVVREEMGLADGPAPTQRSRPVSTRSRSVARAKAV